MTTIFQHLGKFQPAKWGIFNRRKLGNFQPALTIFDTVTKFINSPPGVLVAGGVLATIVWKFFERVEAVLNENTKLEIAIWLLDIKVERFDLRQGLFTDVFDRVFGRVHWSVHCFLRSAPTTIAVIPTSAIGDAS
jgi:hypothetical protein